MRCPYCNSLTTRVLDSRSTQDGTAIRRRRECEGCSERFTTYERYEQMRVFVVKKDGRRELFNRNKVLEGIVKACEKRPVSVESMEEISAGIETRLMKAGKHEVQARDIGELVMDKLRDIDRVAYVRFASVYREFRDLDHFMDIISELKTDFSKR